MTTIQLNNENKTQVELTYDHGLPYKKAIRPEIEYGNWKEDNSFTLFKINLSNDDLLLIKDKHNIECKSITKINKEVWFDLEDVYLVFETNSFLDGKIKNEKFSLIFYQNNNWLSSWGLSSKK